MVAGKIYPVSVTLENNGRAEWTMNNLYRLGSQNPQDNDWWGGRIVLALGENILPGETKTFMFKVTAPLEPGTYDFQWRMVQENVEWFGDFTKNVSVTVITKGEISPAENTETTITEGEVPSELIAPTSIPAEGSLP
jgi:hypothetical protein